MTYNLGQQKVNSARVRRLLVAALAFGCAFATVTHAQAENITPSTTPTIITPPAGNSAFLVGHALGTQGYVCLPTPTDASIASWTVKGARPEATLFQRFFGQDVQIIQSCFQRYLNRESSRGFRLPSIATNRNPNLSFLVLRTTRTREPRRKNGRLRVFRNE